MSLDHLERRVEWFTGVNRNSAEGRGKVIGFSDGPQALIQPENGGEPFWWRADLTRDVTCTRCDGTGVEP